MNATMFRLGGMTAAVAATLAAGMAAAAPVIVSTGLLTGATFDDPRDAKPMVSDLKGPATSGMLESYVENVDRSGNRDAMGSAIADDTGNAQVGAEVGYSGDTGMSTATLATTVRYTNNAFRIPLVTFSFEILPGEVLITTGPIGLPPRPGELSGGIGYTLKLYDTNNVELDSFRCHIGIINTVRSWEYTDATDDCGLDLVDEFFDGNGQYGVTTKGVTVKTSGFLLLGETLSATLTMDAWVNRTAIDWGGQISAKIGDPSNPALRSAFSVDVVDATTPPSPVPEPGSAWLAGLALLGLGATRAKRGATSRAA